MEPHAFVAEPPELDKGTVVRTPESLLRTLTADEERLVVMCCSLAGDAADDLLGQTAPERVAELRQAAHVFKGMDRTARLAAFTRRFAPPPSAVRTRNLSARLEAEPFWYAAVLCRCVTPPVRDGLLLSPRVRDAWRLRVAPHAALVDHARRFAGRSLVGD